MILELAHTKTDIFQALKHFTLECYHVTKDFPPEERFAMVPQIRRVALSTLNLAEGCSHKSETERKHFLKWPVALLLKLVLHYKTREDLQQLGV